MHAPNRQFEAVYLATEYRVFPDPLTVFVIRCGERSAAVEQLLRQHALVDRAFVTADNPRSRRLDDVENARRLTELKAVLRDAGYTCLPGSGEGRDGTWPPEPSLFVLGIQESEAVRIATRFDQHAIVAGRLGEPARLVWTTATMGSA